MVINDTAFRKFFSINDAGAEGVDSSGDNWIRFKSGVQMCWAPSIETQQWWSYPVAFSVAPTVQISSISRDYTVSFMPGVNNTGGFVAGTHGSNDNSFKASVFAIGRWK